MGLGLLCHQTGWNLTSARRLSKFAQNQMTWRSGSFGHSRTWQDVTVHRDQWMKIGRAFNHQEDNIDYLQKILRSPIDWIHKTNNLVLTFSWGTSSFMLVKCIFSSAHTYCYLLHWHYNIVSTYLGIAIRVKRPAWTVHYYRFISPYIKNP